MYLLLSIMFRVFVIKKQQNIDQKNKFNIVQNVILYNLRM